MEQQKSRGSASCAVCLAKELGFCRVFAEDVEKDRRFSDSIEQSEHTVPPRRIICRESDLYDVVPFICEGWAAASASLPDGRRQILAFLLPGDIVSSTSVFTPPPHCVVEAITFVRHRNFRRSDLKAVLGRNEDLILPYTRAWVEEKSRLDQLALDLGRRSAPERIARLVLSLYERLAARRIAADNKMEFPLRQHHIADATGLTAVHVNKVVQDFRRTGMIELTDRTLTIKKTEELKKLATLR